MIQINDAAIRLLPSLRTHFRRVKFNVTEIVEFEFIYPVVKNNSIIIIVFITNVVMLMVIN